VKSLRILFVVLFALASQQALARTPVPVINYENVPIASQAGQPRSLAQIKQAIQSTAAARQWTVVDQGPGRLLATLHVRGKHTVVTLITYTPDRFSVVYSDSINMHYSPGPDGGGVIHPFYNRWVQGLADAIRVSLVN
jgi:hypothetical protein